MHCFIRAFSAISILLLAAQLFGAVRAPCSQDYECDTGEYCDGFYCQYSSVQPSNTPKPPLTNSTVPPELDRGNYTQETFHYPNSTVNTTLPPPPGNQPSNTANGPSPILASGNNASNNETSNIGAVGSGNRSNISTEPASSPLSSNGSILPAESKNASQLPSETSARTSSEPGFPAQDFRTALPSDFPVLLLGGVCIGGIIIILAVAAFILSKKRKYS